MAARLQPTPEGTVVDQENPLSRPIEDERRGRDMPGKGAAGMNVIPAFDLATEDGVSVIGHTEGPGVIVEDRSDMIPEGCRIETHGRTLLEHRMNPLFADADLRFRTML
jgi:hypothetical protein